VKRALYSITVAVIVMFALPVSQLRTVSIRIECCCPDPAKCHCPDHEKGTSQQPSIQECHKSTQAFDAPTVPAFMPVAIEVTSAPARVVAAVDHTLADPHAPPSLDRPSGPS
jgi:hypothetical protein